MRHARLAALREMARQDVSPHERDIARAKLQAAGEGWDEPPRRPPVAPGIPADRFDGGRPISVFTGFTTTSTGTTFTLNYTINRG